MKKRLLLVLMCFIISISMAHADENELGIGEYTLTVETSDGSPYSGEIFLRLEGTGFTMMREDVVNGALKFQIMSTTDIEKLYVYPVGYAEANSQWLDVTEVGSNIQGRHLGTISFQVPTVSAVFDYTGTAKNMELKVVFNNNNGENQNLYMISVDSDDEVYVAPLNDIECDDVDIHVFSREVKTDHTRWNNNTFDNTISLIKRPVHTAKVYRADDTLYNGKLWIILKTSDGYSDLEFLDVTDGEVEFIMSDHNVGYAENQFFSSDVNWQYMAFISDDVHYPNTTIIDVTAYDSSSEAHDFGNVVLKEATMNGWIEKNGIKQSDVSLIVEHTLSDGFLFRTYRSTVGSEFGFAPFEDSYTGTMKITSDDIEGLELVKPYDEKDIVIANDVDSVGKMEINLRDSNGDSYSGPVRIITNTGSVFEGSAIGGVVELEANAQLIGTHLYVMPKDGLETNSRMIDTSNYSIDFTNVYFDVKLQTPQISGSLLFDGNPLADQMIDIYLNNGEVIHSFTDQSGLFKAASSSDKLPTNYYIRYTKDDTEYVTAYTETLMDDSLVLEAKGADNVQATIKTSGGDLYDGEVELCLYTVDGVFRKIDRIQNGALSFLVDESMNYEGISVSPREGTDANSKFVALPVELESSNDLGEIQFQTALNIGDIQFQAWKNKAIINVQYQSGDREFITELRTNDKFYIAPLTDGSFERVKLTATTTDAVFDSELFSSQSSRVTMNDYTNKELRVAVNNMDMEGYYYNNAYYHKEGTTLSLDLQLFGDDGIEIPVNDSELKITKTDSKNIVTILNDFNIFGDLVVSGNDDSNRYRVEYGNISTEFSVITYKGNLGLCNIIKPDNSAYEKMGEDFVIFSSSGNSIKEGSLKMAENGKMIVYFPETTDELDNFDYLLFPWNSNGETLGNNKLRDLKTTYTKLPSGIYELGDIVLQEATFAGSAKDAQSNVLSSGTVYIDFTYRDAQRGGFRSEVTLVDGKFYLADLGDLLSPNIKVSIADSTGKIYIKDKSINLSTTTAYTFEPESTNQNNDQGSSDSGSGSPNTGGGSSSSGPPPAPSSGGGAPIPFVPKVDEVEKKPVIVEDDKQVVELVKTKEGQKVEFDVKDMDKVAKKVRFDSEIAKVEIPKTVLEDFKKVKLVVNDDVVLTEEQESIVGDAVVYDFNLYNVDDEEDEKVSEFKSAITVNIPYTLKEGENPELLTVFYLSDDNELENISGVYKDGFITFETNHFSKYFAKENKVTFDDVDNNAVSVLAAKGVIVGKADNKFEPKSHLTRAETATILVKAFKLSEVDEHALPFSDVDAKHWAYNFVNIARHNKLASGVGENQFNPEGNVKRQDSAIMIANILKSDTELESEMKTYSVTDAYAFNFITYLVDKNILSSHYTNGRAFITREEFCELVYDSIYKTND